MTVLVRLRKAALYGTLSEWREACEAAKAVGFTEAQVQRVLFLWHPLSALLGFLTIFAVVAAYLIEVG